jgi:hypothetical protein
MASLRHQAHSKQRESNKQFIQIRAQLIYPVPDRERDTDYSVSACLPPSTQQQQTGLELANFTGGANKKDLQLGPEQKWINFRAMSDVDGRIRDRACPPYD